MKSFNIAGREGWQSDTEKSSILCRQTREYYDVSKATSVQYKQYQDERDTFMNGYQVNNPTKIHKNAHEKMFNVRIYRWS